MAHMIPASPRFHTNNDHENEIFKSLETGLSDEYTVIHSFHSIQRNGKIISDCQSDFLIYHPQKGFLSIEAKYSDHIRYERGEWFFDKETNEVRGKIELQPKKPYFAFEIRDDKKSKF